MSLTLAIIVIPVITLILGLPIYLVLLTTSSAAVLVYMNVPATVIPQIMFGSLDKFVLLSVPFFIFAGDIMARGGVSKRIINCVLAIFGRYSAARPITTIAASEFFGSVAGSSPATVAAMGKLMYPSLREGGYSERFSLGLITAAGGIAGVMPPSILMILYGSSAEVSIAELFAAGILPALLMGVAMLTYVLWHSRSVKEPPMAKRSFKQTILLIGNALPALGTPLVILGGIYSGIFSPTESAGIAGVYGILVTKYIYRELSWTELWASVENSAKLSAQILIVVAASGVFSWVLTTSGIPQILVSVVGDYSNSYWMTLLAINIFLLLLGCVIDPVSAIVLFTPILLPIVSYMGIDLVHFGVIMAVNLSIGMFTPPLGLNIFTAKVLFNAKMSTICRGVIPFIIAQIIALMIITYVPAISMLSASLVK